jgi:hypothetical protein
VQNDPEVVALRAELDCMRAEVAAMREEGLLRTGSSRSSRCRGASNHGGGGVLVPRSGGAAGSQHGGSWGRGTAQQPGTAESALSGRERAWQRNLERRQRAQGASTSSQAGKENDSDGGDGGGWLHAEGIYVPPSKSCDGDVSERMVLRSRNGKPRVVDAPLPCPQARLLNRQQHQRAQARSVSKGGMHALLQPAGEGSAMRQALHQHQRLPTPSPSVRRHAQQVEDDMRSVRALQ